MKLSHLALLLLLLALPDPAQAATVRLSVDVEPADPDDFRDDISTFAVLDYRAAAGERNRLRVRLAGEDRVVFTDPGARIRPGKGCRAAEPHRAVCRFPDAYADLQTVRARLGDRNDRFAAGRLDPDVYGNDVVVRGGPGADRLRGSLRLSSSLRGGPGGDRLRGGGARDGLAGGPGADVLAARGARDSLADGPGRDRLWGGRGDDLLASADSGPDAFAGGPGLDTVTYARRRAAVTVTLGARDEGDATRSVEGLTGGRGADRLTGSDGPDRLEGGPGDDVVAGAAGDDEIRASPGDDVIAAGPGDDLVRPVFFAGTQDVACGPGDDRGPAAGEQALLREDCERLQSWGVAAQPAAVTAEAVVLRVPCSTSTSATASRRVQLLTPRSGPPWYPARRAVLVAAGSVPFDQVRATCDVVLELTPEGAALQRPLPVVAVLPTSASWTFLLVPPAAMTR